VTERFRLALQTLGVPDGVELGLAVSGGPDSLALLLMAVDDRPGRVRAATVDHGLRPKARAEAEEVAAVCRERNVPHDILTVQVKGSVQAGARAARYAALGDWCGQNGLAWLATAHHADDQAETVLMRLARGSGLSGLAGIRRSRLLRPGVRLIRPLLDWRKAELEALADAAGLTPAFDPSNADPAYDRTRARALLAEAGWLSAARLARTADHLAEVEAALEWAVASIAEERIGADWIDPHALPPELLRRAMLRLLAQHGVQPSGPALARLTETLKAGKPATIGHLLLRSGARWTVSPAPERRPR
jgi:tRNA(Ile)-lysidine synthase